MDRIKELKSEGGHEDFIDFLKGFMDVHALYVDKAVRDKGHKLILLEMRVR